ncbi:RNA ligase (ATP) [Lewinella sp. LCG006]|uniref:RNA ligase (ATP) n=1 Tax=Lewinella sp. LCG006 TaxID=3231911 RepID=UPI00345FA9A6
MRKLASLQRITALEPIPNADSILKATVLGWQLVVKKGEFSVGDLCVYVEIDSILPDRPEFEFLRAKSNRIRTVRLRGQISQGVCFPLSILPDSVEVAEGLDVTTVLDIEKYEPPIPAQLSGIMKGGFPSFIPKTDETRVQILADLLEKYEGERCFITEKLDGSSVTYYWNEGEFGVCSRNMELEKSVDNSFWKVAIDLDIEAKLKQLGQHIAIQGELIGEGIQSNKYKLKGQTVRFFNAFAISNNQYLDYVDFRKLLEALALPIVPVLEENFSLVSDINTLVDLSVGGSVLRKETRREGIVIRPLKEQIDQIGRVSFKVINPGFLLKYEDA